MEQLRGGAGGPINSFMSSQFLDYSSHLSFLQMLNRATQKQEAEEEENNYNPHCFFQPEPNMQQSRVTADVSSDNVGHSMTKKRKRARRPPPPPPSVKNKVEAESQRVNHIAVERNRRKLMNCHLSTLRSLMPESYVQRGDQASIIGGAIDFVKQLEQLLMSLQAMKRKKKKKMMMMKSPSSSSYEDAVLAEECNVVGGELFVSPQFTGYTDYYCRRVGGAHPDGVDVEATLVQGHVNLKVLGRRRRRGELVGVVAALEEIGLCVLHLNVASVDACSVFYCLNLKMEEGCKVGTADKVAMAVHHIFSYISACYSDGGGGAILDEMRQ